ncbi:MULTISPECIES: hypothetical protein [unclassified Streptomyces]|uniref:hypothetical protein n=1 Tax=unclassified Streptomyces TaxID=2593676 RepID=UPI0004C524C9|nr:MULTISPECIES: hypothetical protein [unclassified Streptomyces]
MACATIRPAITSARIEVARGLDDRQHLVLGHGLRLYKLLGFRFAPRFRDLSDQRFRRPACPTARCRPTGTGRWWRSRLYSSRHGRHDQAQLAALGELGIDRAR